MRIIYVTMSLPYGWSETYVIPEIEALQARGCDVLVVPRSPTGGIIHGDARRLLERTRTEPVVSGRILGTATTVAARHPVGTVRMLAAVVGGSSLANRAKNLSVYPKGLWLAQVARAWGADHIHAHFAITSTTLAMIAGEVSGVPWSFTAHRGDIVRNNLLRLKTERAAFARFISESSLRLGVARGAVAEKCFVIPMGVELPSVTPKPPVPRERPVLLCPGSLLPVKGHKYLIDAVRILESRGCPVALRLAGDGELRADLEAQVTALGLQHAITFLGTVPHDQIIRWYQDGEVDVVTLPSLDLGGGLHEGIPVALLEAMAHGVPVVSTCTGGIPELVVENTGILVQPGDAEALAQAIEGLARDAAARHALGAAGRERVEQRFSVDAAADALLARFRESASGLAQSRQP